MSELSKALDLILKIYVTPILKNAGFRKSGRKYRRVLSNVVDTVTIESSSWNRGDEGNFTIMLTVVKSDLLLRKKPEEFELAKATGLESGIICLSDNLIASRFSFSVNASENISLGNRLEELANNHCLDWFEQTRDDVDLIKLLEKEKSMFALEALAILYMRNGFKSKCSDALNVILSRRPDLLGDLKRWANQKGLYFESDA